LRDLAVYLQAIAPLDGFEALDHRKWRKFAARHGLPPE